MEKHRKGVFSTGNKTDITSDQNDTVQEKYDAFKVFAKTCDRNAVFIPLMTNDYNGCCCCTTEFTHGP